MRVLLHLLDTPHKFIKSVLAVFRTIGVLVFSTWTPEQPFGSFQVDKKSLFELFSLNYLHIATAYNTLDWATWKTQGPGYWQVLAP